MPCDDGGGQASPAPLQRSAACGEAGGACKGDRKRNAGVLGSRDRAQPPGHADMRSRVRREAPRQQRSLSRGPVAVLWGYRRGGAAGPRDACPWPLPSSPGCILANVQLPAPAFSGPAALLLAPESILLPTEQAASAQELLSPGSSLFYVTWPRPGEAAGGSLPPPHSAWAAWNVGSRIKPCFRGPRG